MGRGGRLRLWKQLPMEEASLNLVEVLLEQLSYCIGRLGVSARMPAKFLLEQTSASLGWGRTGCLDFFASAFFHVVGGSGTAAGGGGAAWEETLGLGAMSLRHARAASLVARVALLSSAVVMLNVLICATSVFISSSEIRATGFSEKIRFRSELHASLIGSIDRRKSGFAR